MMCFLNTVTKYLYADIVSKLPDWIGTACRKVADGDEILRAQPKLVSLSLVCQHEFGKTG